MTDPYDDAEGHGGSPHEAFDPDQLIGPDDVLLGVAPLAFTGGTPSLLADVTAYGEGTLSKVREALLSCSPDLDEEAVTGQITAMQNAGILFREQKGTEPHPAVGVIDGDADVNLPGTDVYRVVNADGDVVRQIIVREDLEVGDRYHTIGELYEHRRALTAVLATIGAVNGDSWRSKRHHPEDGPMFDGSFIVGIELPAGPISYHYPLSSWDEFAAVREVEHAPKWDGAGPADTLDRLADFTAHLKAAIDSGREVQEEAREAADAVVEVAEVETVTHVPGGGCCTAVVAAEEEEDVRP